MAFKQGKRQACELVELLPGSLTRRSVGVMVGYAAVQPGRHREIILCDTGLQKRLVCGVIVEVLLHMAPQLKDFIRSRGRNLEGHLVHPTIMIKHPDLRNRS